MKFKLKSILKNIPLIFTNYPGLIFIFTVAVIIITYQRLNFGVIFTDEAFYVAIPYRFALGDKPFIDELNLVQTSSLLTYPFIKFYIWLTGSIDGIILFMRRLWLVFTFLVSGSIFLALKNNLKQQTALIISLTSIAFMPFVIPSLSYNTLGSGFFTTGCFLGLWVVLKSKNPRYLFFSGLSHGLAIIAYPTLLIPSILFLSIILFSLPIKKTQGFLGYCSGGLLIVLFLLPTFVNAGLYNLRACFDHMISIGVQGGGTAKIIKIINDLWNNYPNKILSLFVLLSIFIGFKTKLTFLKYTLFLIPLILIKLVRFQDHSASMRYISYYALLAPYFLLFIRNNKFTKRLFYCIWIPSFVAGAVTAWNSGNGYKNAAIGLFPASLVTSVFLVILFKKISLKRKSQLHIFLPIIMVSILLFFQYSAVYEDNKIIKLNTKVNFGPYKGLYTTKAKNKYMYDLFLDIKTITGSDDERILVYDNFPAGYLFTSMRPAIDTVWPRSMSRFPNMNRQDTIDYYQKSNIKPDVAIKIKKRFIRENYILDLVYVKNDPINNKIEGPEYKEVLSRENYTIYKNQP